MASGLSRRTRIVLIVSLAVNVFAVGALSAAWIFHGIPGMGAESRPGRFIGMPLPRHMHAALPERDRPRLEATLQSHRPQIRAHMREIAAARRAVAEAIGAEPFDRPRLEAAFAALRDKEGSTAAEAHRLITDLVSGLDAEGRRRIAELVPTRGRRGH